MGSQTTKRIDIAEYKDSIFLDLKRSLNSAYHVESNSNKYTVFNNYDTTVLRSQLNCLNEAINKYHHSLHKKLSGEINELLIERVREHHIRYSTSTGSNSNSWALLWSDIFTFSRTLKTAKKSRSGHLKCYF